MTLLYYDLTVIVLLLQYHDIIHYMMNFAIRQAWIATNVESMLQIIIELNSESQ